MVFVTLEKMAAGGMHDHLGGGFHRYSVDAFWHVPHFEKMLYDQAQLAIAYLEAFQLTRRAEFETTARSILRYVERDLRAPKGGFYSAEDADSLFEHGKPEHGEGAFYSWAKTEIDQSLGSDAEIFCYRYGVDESGNVRAESDPHHEFVRKNILFEAHTDAETAEQFRLDGPQLQERLDRARKKLLDFRARRPRPHLDDKIIAAWNGLMISAFARASQILDDPHYAQIATSAVEFLMRELFDGSRGTLTRSYREGPSAVDGFADDYAFVIQGLLDLYETTFETGLLKFALQLQETLDARFYDRTNGGYFTTTDGDPSILLRLKEDNDGAEPAASSVAALNLLRLAQTFDDSTMRDRAEKTIRAFSAQLGHFPTALPQMLVALDYSSSGQQQIVIAGNRDNESTRVLLREVRSHFLPNTLVLLADGAADQQFLAQRNAAFESMRPIDGRSAAYVCENFTCSAPVTDQAALHALLVTSR